MTKVKAPEKQSVSFALTEEQLADLDAEINALIAGIPGAKLSRAAFVEQLVVDRIAARKAARTATGEAPAPALAPVPAGKPKRAA